MAQPSLTVHGAALACARAREKPALFVTTTLDAWELPTPDNYAADVTLNEIPHRKLDPDYYAWLRHRMARVKHRADKGAIPPETFHALRDKFNRIHTWAVERFGEAALTQAVQSLDPKCYAPPKAHPDRCFQGILQLPPDQSHWPPALRDIWNEIVQDLTSWGIDQQEATSVAQGIVECLAGKKPVVQREDPVRSALPF